MKFSLFLFASAVAATSAAKVPAKNALRDGDDMIHIVQTAVYNFEVEAEVEPTPSDDADAFITSCFMNSYNDIHDPTQYMIESVEVVGETISKVDDQNSNNKANNLDWDRYIFVYGLENEVWSAVCRFCPPDFLAESKKVVSDFADWESAFCGCLGGSSDAVLSTAKNCEITLTSDDGKHDDNKKAVDIKSDDDMVKTQHEAKITFTADVSELSPEENSFVMLTLLETYNELHDPAEAVMEAASMVKEVAVPVETVSQKSAGGLRQYPQFFWIWQSFGTLITATCTFCPPFVQESDPSVPYPYLNVPSMADWENLFCDKLKTGTFDAFKQIEGCKIEFLTKEAITSSMAKMEE